jgi:hypothetical protein
VYPIFLLFFARVTNMVDVATAAASFARYREVIVKDASFVRNGPKVGHKRRLSFE